jgi:hypothetical protein
MLECTLDEEIHHQASGSFNKKRRKKMKRLFGPMERVVMISLSVMLTLVLSSPPVFADTLDSMQQQIEALQNQVQALKEKQDTEAEKTKAPAKANKKGSVMLSGLNTELTIGGYAKLDVIYSDVGAGADSDADRYFYPPAIPLDSADTSSKTTFTGKQSRLFAETRTPTSWGDLKVHIEGDFYGQGGNQKVSNSSTWRLRHAYGELGNLMAGQNWSTFMNVGALPETIDFGGPAASIFIRQAQIRWTQPFQWGSVQLAAENPETWLVANDASISTAPDNDRVPDVVARLNLNTGVGKFSLAALGREYRIDSQGVDDSTYAGAVSLAGTIPTFGKDDLKITFSYGNGLGRYMVTNFGDAQLDVNTGEMEAFDQWGGFAAYRHFWTDTLRSTVAYSYGEADNNIDIVGTAVNKKFQSVHGNLIWSPVPAVSLGVEYIWGYREREDDEEGNLNRVQFGAQYNFF